MNEPSTMRHRIPSLADLAAHAPSLYQVLSRVGRQRRRRRAVRLAQNAGWFGAGIALGSGIATLLTPNSGSEMRHRLSARARRVREYLAPGNGDGTHARHVETHRDLRAHREGP